MRYVLCLILLCNSIITYTTEANSETPQSQEIVLYYSSKCPYSKKVLSYLSNQDIKIPMKDVLYDAQAKTELKQYGYMIVPCLVVKGTPIYDANDIIEWLSKNF